MTVQFADLRFATHAKLPSGRGIDQAIAVFPNGWRLSVLRGLHAVNLWELDYETCRVHPTDGLQSDTLQSLDTIEDVQREMDAVAALPAAAGFCR
jgi:hypothetical protein